MNDIIITLASHWHGIVITLLITIPILVIGLKLGAITDTKFNNAKQ